MLIILLSSSPSLWTHFSGVPPPVVLPWCVRVAVLTQSESTLGSNTATCCSLARLIVGKSLSSSKRHFVGSWLRTCSNRVSKQASESTYAAKWTRVNPFSSTIFVMSKFVFARTELRPVKSLLLIWLMILISSYFSSRNSSKSSMEKVLVDAN